MRKGSTKVVATGIEMSGQSWDRGIGSTRLGYVLNFGDETETRV